MKNIVPIVEDNRYMAFYYISDLHFGHANVIRFDHRPFSNTEEMEEVLVMNWNAVVSSGDTVHILGDFCWGKADEWNRILRRLKGNKVLILGNHDLSQYPPALRQHFADIKDYKEIEDNGRRVLMSHYPQLFYKRSSNPKYHMLCGHVHRTAENTLLEKWITELRRATKVDGVHASNRGQIYNVGCMMPWIHYTPQTLDEIIRGRDAYLEQKEGDEYGSSTS